MKPSYVEIGIGLFMLALAGVALADTATTQWEAGVPYVDRGATANDNYDGDITARIVTTGAVNPNALGAYTVTYNVADLSSNAAVPVTRTIIVKDTRPPVIKLNGGPILYIQRKPPSFVVAGLGATALDSFSGVCQCTWTGPLDLTKAGIYTITYRAVDPSGNASETKQIIGVFGKPW